MHKHFLVLLIQVTQKNYNTDKIRNSWPILVIVPCKNQVKKNVHFVRRTTPPTNAHTIPKHFPSRPFFVRRRRCSITQTSIFPFQTTQCQTFRRHTRWVYLSARYLSRPWTSSVPDKSATLINDNGRFRYRRDNLGVRSRPTCICERTAAYIKGALKTAYDAKLCIFYSVDGRYRLFGNYRTYSPEWQCGRRRRFICIQGLFSRSVNFRRDKNS